MATEKQIQANRQNAQRSTGPRTPAGKARSSQNAIKHGARCEKHIVLDGEDPQQYQFELDRWFDHCGGDPAQEALAEQACRVSWKLRRMDRADTARTACRMRHAVDDYDLDQHRRAHQLGADLLHDPVNRCRHLKPEIPVVLEDLERWRAIDPALIVAELQTFAAGVDWMLARWRALQEVLRNESFWHYDHKYHVTKLLGKRPEDIMNDRTARDIFLACNVLHPQAWRLLDDAIQSVQGSQGRPAYYYRLQTWEKTCWPGKQLSFAYLSGLTEREIARLEALKRIHLDPLDERDRAQAPTRALVDTTPAAALTHRYEGQLERSLRGCVSGLANLRKQSNYVPPVPVEEPQSEPEMSGSWWATEPEPEGPPLLHGATLGRAAEVLPLVVGLPVGSPTRSGLFEAFASRYLPDEPESYMAWEPPAEWDGAEIIPHDPPRR